MRAPTTMGVLVAIAALAGASAATRAEAQGGPRRWRGRPETVTVPPPSGTGRLRNAAQGMCLDVAGWAAQGNGDVLLWECNNDPDHVWSFSPTGELRNTLTGVCLDAAGYDGAQGADVGIFRCEGLDDQRWTLVARGPGMFEVRNVKRGMCLDVNGKAGGRGDNVLLWGCTGDADQMWSWEPYASPPQRRVQAPPPPPPPPPPARESRRPMPDDAFQGLVATVKNEAFSQSQLDVIEQAARRNHFRVAQVRALIDLLSFSETKLRALELGAPRIVDPENSFTIYDAFTFSADKEQAKQILKRNGL